MTATAASGRILAAEAPAFMTDAVLKLSDLLPMDRLAVTVRDAIGEGLGKRGATPRLDAGAKQHVRPAAPRLRHQRARRH